MSGSRAAARTFHAEVLKLLTLPALYLTASVTWAATPLLAVAYVSAAARGGGGPGTGQDAGLAPVGYAQAGFVVLGVLAAASEYRGGQIRTTLTCVPRRVEAQLAKAAALAVTALPVAVATAASGVLAAHAAHAPPYGAAVPVDVPGAVRAVAGATAYLVLTVLLSSAVATLTRGTIPAVTVLLGHYFVVGPYLDGRTALAAYLPGTAGLWPGGGADVGGVLGTGGRWVVVTGWTVAALCVAIVSFRRRDA
ncbi:hypothetical protein AB0D67_17545 [Streptosporangium sp. NPDC048047]|uniref:hypothetical protein n=1 Tax=Streptosporangium sp. NPDC048047 TaxID=3155748 RepID=UPI0034443D76